MIEIRWHGRGGQGSFTASKLLGVAATIYEGKHALAFPSFGPERRGAPVLAFTKIDTKKITDRSEIKQCDYIVVIDETLFNKSFINDLKPGGKIILNGHNPALYSDIDADKLVIVDVSSTALQILGKPIANTAMLGALAGISGITDLESISNGMEQFLKGQLLERNRELVKRIYNQSKEVLQ